MRNPAFIIGCPRSGTTISQEILSSHPETCWFSTYTNLLPQLPQLSYLSKLYRLPLFRKFYGSSILLPMPCEAWRLWQYYCPVFLLPRPLRQRPVPLTKVHARRYKESIRRVVAKRVSYHGGKKFITKYTNKPRIIFLNEIFPNAQFIHVLRDPRAVVNSLLYKVAREGWFREPEPCMWKQLWPGEWLMRLDEYERLLEDDSELGDGRDVSIAFLSFYYRWILESIRRQSRILPEERYMEFSYEEFTIDLGGFKVVTDFLGLDFSPAEEYLESVDLSSRNYKYKKNFDALEIEIIDEVTGGIG
ncbi:MAG: sulfotransferase family protein [archaeon]